MNYTEYKHVEDHPPFSILKSPVGGYWLVTFTVTGDPIFRHCTKTLECARRIAALELQIAAQLQRDLENHNA